MALKNTYSGVPVDRIFQTIQKILVTHKAKQLMFEYSDDGRVYALTFSLEINKKLHAFKLPARVKSVEHILYGTRPPTPTQKEQAYRTAWANIRDWISAQMALIETGMVKFEEVFLPYMVDRSGKTYFETLEQKQFELESGKPLEGEILEPSS
jgi:hypothetical protein